MELLTTPRLLGFTANVRKRRCIHLTAIMVGHTRSTMPLPYVVIKIDYCLN